MRKLRFFKDSPEKGRHNLLSKYSNPKNFGKKPQPEVTVEEEEEELPTLDWLKKDIQAYLDDKKIIYKPKDSKSVLLKLCK